MILFTRNSFCSALIATTRTTTTTTFEYSGENSLHIGEQHHQQVDQQPQLGPAAQFVRTQVNEYLKYDPTISGPILRLAFHDAAVRDKSSNPMIGGANGSIRYELEWSENRGLSKPMKVIQDIYEAQNSNSHCQGNNLGATASNDNDNGNNANNDTIIKTPSPSCQSQILSFADVLALAGAEVVEKAGGPQIPIKLGRIDVSSPDNKLLDIEIPSESERSLIKTSLPSPGLDSLGLRNYFHRLGLTDSEMVALMGSHDLGRHVTLTGMSKECLRNLTRSCLEDAPTLVPFVTKNPDTFSNAYFEVLLRWNQRKIEFGEAAFIPTDVALVVDNDLRETVERFANDQDVFFQTFRSAYQKLVDSTATSLMSY